MYSPFYTAEQKRLYPYRNIEIMSIQQAADYFRGLINDGSITTEILSSQNLGSIKHSFLPNCSVETIYEALQLL